MGAMDDLHRGNDRNRSQPCRVLDDEREVGRSQQRIFYTRRITDSPIHQKFALLNSNGNFDDLESARFQ